MVTKAKTKKPAAAKAAVKKPTAKKVSAHAAKSASKSVAKKTPPPAAAPKKKVAAAPAVEPVVSKKKLSPKELEAEKRKAKATAAVKAAMAATSTPTTEDEDEFDPAAFFAASGGKGLFKAHVMRKERVDFALVVRYRFLSGPLVFNAELLNLSKGGLCLRTPDVVKTKAVIRIEIPLPHTSELFAVQAECVWSDAVPGSKGKDRPVNTGLKFLPMSLAKQTVINQFIQQRRDEIIMAKIGLDKFTDSVPVAGLD